MKKYLIFLAMALLSLSVFAQQQGKKKFTKQQKKTLKSSKGFNGGGFNDAVLKTNCFDLQGGIGEESYFFSLAYSKNVTKKLVRGQLLYEQGTYFDVAYQGYYLSATGGYQLVNFNEKLHFSIYSGGVIVSDKFTSNLAEGVDKLAAYNKVNYGGIGIVDIDAGLSNSIFLFANFQQMYILSMPKSQKGRWLAGVGIRFLL